MDRNSKIKVIDLKREVLQQNYVKHNTGKQKELIKVRQDLKYTEKIYRLQEERIERNKENYTQTVRQFDAGRVLIKEMIESDFLCQQAKSDYLQALYVHMKAKIERTRIY